MMKLILSLALIWMLSSTAGALQCQNTQNSSLVDCNKYCAAAAIQSSSGEQQSKLCLSSSVCKPNNQTFSYNIGFSNLTAFVHCCNTNDCNRQNVSYPVVQETNKLQCLTCDDDQSTVCNKIEWCVGVQDRCISGSVMVSNNIKKAFGCASKNLCGDTPELRYLDVYLNFTNGPKCCGTNRCNSAWTVKLSVVPFLLGLILLVAR
ncbi:urokinase plasminogen activator surface receptor-like [Sebastes umbrosus]|uniref:urokinase plasminogen activator surface receptor-like n=1 Tax=Sebastes umbrosus TaxID=72105 RepID=UPI00189C6171|nr:urokinase plasminogen activator surface receptor-like [Sebastes umbrosus]